MSVQEIDVALVGAGFGGIFMTHQLREAGLSVRCFEAGDDVGGAWYWNIYPGAQTDSEFSYYCLTFSERVRKEWRWRHKYPSQQEMADYFRFVADTHDLGPRIALSSPVTGAHWSEEESRWRLTVGRDEQVSARFLVSCVGLLTAPNVPRLPGLDSFTGSVFHTSRWPRDGVDLQGSRVGVIGVGSTGVQAIPQLAAQAEELLVFQRTPNFILPARNRELTEADHVQAEQTFEERQALMRRHPNSMPFQPSGLRAADLSPEEQQELLWRCWERGGFSILFEGFDDVTTDPRANEITAEFIRERMREVIDDPETARVLVPQGYPLGGKRPPCGHQYLETFNLPQVTVVDVASNPLVRLDESGIVTADGSHHELDILVLATGFDASTGALTRMDVVGSDGHALKEAWAAGPRTHLGFATAGFPNLLMVTGPQSPFNNLPTSVEYTGSWIRRLLEHMRREGLTRVEASTEAQEEWTGEVRRAAEALLPVPEGLTSWYRGNNVEGKATEVNCYFGGAHLYFDRCDVEEDAGYPGLRFA